MSGNTKHYKLIKPTVGGSDNEWGGNLNDDLDTIDALLGGDKPIVGIDIDSGTIDGGAIDGTIGGGANDIIIDSSTEISGKVKRLTGMADPDGIIEQCDVETRDLSVKNSITENQENLGASNNIAVNPMNGTIQYLHVMDPAGQTVNLQMQAGQSVTLVMNWTDGNSAPIISWNADQASIKWIGGGSPNFATGLNVVQFWCMALPTGKTVCGAYSGALS